MTLASPLHWPRQALIALVQGYRYLLKPWLGNACRFEPSCSQYALDALRRHGAAAGATLAAGRLLRDAREAEQLLDHEELGCVGGGGLACLGVCWTGALACV